MRGGAAWRDAAANVWAQPLCWWFKLTQTKVQMNSNSNQLIQNCFDPNKTFLRSKKIEIKYGFKGFNKRNNFP
jgi:hypothetical protein